MPQTAEQEQEIRVAMLDMAKAAGFTEEEFDTMRSALEKGATLADVFNISKEAMESAYAYAYNLYKAGNYKDAESMFRGLCLYDGDDPRFWMGLAGCLQAREAYQLAIDTYGMAGVAGALKARRLLMLTDVSGIKDKNGELIRSLTADRAAALIADGTVSGGMIPKVECCLEALRQGVAKVTVVDGRVENCLLLELLTDQGIGTEIAG